jgi:hypothetical protein
LICVCHLMIIIYGPNTVCGIQLKLKKKGILTQTYDPYIQHMSYIFCEYQ